MTHHPVPAIDHDTHQATALTLVAATLTLLTVLMAPSAEAMIPKPQATRINVSTEASVPWPGQTMNQQAQRYIDVRQVGSDVSESRSARDANRLFNQILGAP